MIVAGDGSLNGVQILEPLTDKQMNTEQFVTPKGKGTTPQMHRELGVQLFPASLVEGRTMAGHQSIAYGMVGGIFL